LHLTAYGGRDDKLFGAAAAESQCFPPLQDTKRTQDAYNSLLKATNCGDLKCLREMDAVQFQRAARALKPDYPTSSGPPLYFWGPTLDKDFIQDYTINEINNGHFVKVPAIFGDTTNEGISFTPGRINSMAAAQDWVTDQFPELTEQDWADIWSIFAPKNVGDASTASTWRDVAAKIYGDIRYICPGLNISNAYAEHNVPVWNYRWNVGSARHISEMRSIWNGGPSAADASIRTYFSRFIRMFDPNKETAEYEGKDLQMPTWEEFGKNGGKRMTFNDGDRVEMEAISAGEVAKCEFLNKLGPQLRL
jgi:carboxylesterase type B